MRYIVILLFLCGCSASTHLKLAKRHELIAISKGASIVRDTVYKTLKVEIPVLGDTSKRSVAPEISIDDFFGDIERNDSLVLIINSLHKAISEGATLDKEKTMASLAKANSEIKALRWRLAQGYSKDSVYVVEADSLCTVKAEVKDGLLRSLEHTRKPTVAKADFVIPAGIRNILEAGYSWQHLLFGGIGLAFVFLVIGFIVGYITKNK